MKKAVAYMEQRKEKLMAILQLPPQAFEPETFHQLRVEIKKIRAVMVIVGKLNPDCLPPKKYRRPLRQVFKSAGIIREKQIESTFIQSVLPEDGGAKLLLLQLEETEIAQKAEFRQLINDDLLHCIGQLSDKLSACLAQLNKKEVEAWVLRKSRKLLQKIKRLPEKAADWHEVRKQLKVHNYLTACTGFTTDQWQPETIAELQELLGKWHDCHAMIQSFQQQAETQQTPFVKETLHKLIKHLTSQQQTIAQQITTSAASFGAESQ
jgi:CHAD domain-containing protein